jgi:hypothetical protein
MTGSNPQQLGLMPKLVVVLGILLVAAGVLWHGITVEVLERIWRNLLDAPRGPMSFRFILQPLMSAIVAIHDSVKDARTSRLRHFWTVADNPRERMERLREGLIATARIILLGMAMDVIYQFLVFKTFYPAQALLIALLLAFVPYLLIRGPATRIVRWWRGGVSGGTR